MPVPDVSGVPPFADFEMMRTKLNEIVQKFNNLLVSLDDFNFNKITAKVMDVDELSAISANLGHITAGLIEAVTMIASTITGSLIQTVTEGNYPRTSLSSSNQVFAVEGDPSRKLWIYVIGADPNIRFTDLIGTSSIGHFGGNLDIAASGRINLSSAPGVYVNGVKLNPVNGVTGSIAVMDPSGGTRQLIFNNGVYQGAI